jgi:hypothetical protein
MLERKLIEATVVKPVLHRRYFAVRPFSPPKRSGSGPAATKPRIAAQSPLGVSLRSVSRSSRGYPGADPHPIVSSASSYASSLRLVAGPDETR